MQDWLQVFPPNANTSEIRSFDRRTRFFGVPHQSHKTSCPPWISTCRPVLMACRQEFLDFPEKSTSVRCFMSTSTSWSVHDLSAICTGSLRWNSPGGTKVMTALDSRLRMNTFSPSSTGSRCGSSLKKPFVRRLMVRSRGLPTQKDWESWMDFKIARRAGGTLSTWKSSPYPHGAADCSGNSCLPVHRSVFPMSNVSLTCFFSSIIRTPPSPWCE
mmetsp:Transcript_14687/g.33727  ORF Transcript_14687/g.33727 Transcript_14687/m.33727 type:complete len:215 (-) Transcript_14687:346-990(-)